VQFLITGIFRAMISHWIISLCDGQQGCDYLCVGWPREPNQVRVIHSLFIAILFRACLSTHILGIIAA